MQTKIQFEEANIQSALAELALSVEILQDALKFGFLALASCTANDPPFLPAFLMWGRVVRGLRENLIPNAWTKSDEKNYCTINDPTGRFAIAVSSGDENTGCPDANPTTKCAKGPSTVDAVYTNLGQLQIFPVGEVYPTPVIEDGKITWLLLFHIDHSKDEIRAELSLPASMGDDGRINGWSDRIILPAISLNSTPPIPTDFAPDIEIEIRKKTG